MMMMMMMMMMVMVVVVVNSGGSRLVCNCGLLRCSVTKTHHYCLVVFFMEFEQQIS